MRSILISTMRASSTVMPAVTMFPLTCTWQAHAEDAFDFQAVGGNGGHDHGLGRMRINRRGIGGFDDRRRLEESTGHAEGILGRWILRQRPPRTVVCSSWQWDRSAGRGVHRRRSGWRRDQIAGVHRSLDRRPHFPVPLRKWNARTARSTAPSAPRDALAPWRRRVLRQADFCQIRPWVTVRLAWRCPISNDLARRPIRRFVPGGVEDQFFEADQFTVGAAHPVGKR